MYYVYMLRCGDGSLYSGITTDLERRLAEHRGQGGRGAKYTARRRPLGYAAAWTAPDRSAALKLECRLKSLTKGEKEALLRGAETERAALPGCVRIAVSRDGGREE